MSRVPCKSKECKDRPRLIGHPEHSFYGLPTQPLTLALFRLADGTPSLSLFVPFRRFAFFATILGTEESRLDAREVQQGRVGQTVRSEISPLFGFITREDQPFGTRFKI